LSSLHERLDFLQLAAQRLRPGAIGTAMQNPFRPFRRKLHAIAEPMPPDAPVMAMTLSKSSAGFIELRSGRDTEGLIRFCIPRSALE